MKEEEPKSGSLHMSLFNLHSLQTSPQLHSVSSALLDNSLVQLILKLYQRAFFVSKHF